MTKIETHYAPENLTCNRCEKTGEIMYSDYLTGQDLDPYKCQYCGAEYAFDAVPQTVVMNEANEITSEPSN